MTAGWMRSVGHVTPVVTCMPGTWVASAPITDHTNGLWPCSSFHGWKWSEIHRPLDARGLREPRLIEQLAGGELLAGEEAADAHTPRRYPAAPP